MISFHSKEICGSVLFFHLFPPLFKVEIMITPRLPFQYLFAASSLFVLSSCEKSILSPDNTTTEVANDECPSFSAHLSEITEAQTSRNAQLLQYFNQSEIADLQENTCLTKTLSDNGEGLEERATGLKYKFWAPGTTIRVRFINGSTALQQKVFACAKEWESYADIHFSQVSSGTSDVRILFGQDGHWSYIGTDNKSIEACSETMSLQLTDVTSATEIRRVALHEFGHVLGMLHEHQQPLSSIPWNASAVYNYYAQQDWTRQEVDEQVLNKSSAETSQYTNFDAASIMEYPVPASLTTNGFSIGWNTQVSANDKNYINLMYSSQRMRIRHAATGYNANISFQLAGIYHTLKPGETLSVPALAGTNALAIWEQASGSSWAWDTGYAPVYGKNYKIVRVGTTNNLTLAAE